MKLNSVLINFILSLEDYKLCVLNDCNYFLVNDDHIQDFIKDNFDLFIEYINIDDVYKKIELRFY